MSISTITILKNVSIITLTTISGSIAWDLCKELNIYPIYEKVFYRNKSIFIINLNFGMLIGFGLGISYVYTGKPLLYNFSKEYI